MTTTQQRRTKPQPLVNRVLVAVLRSPVSRLVDRSLLASMEKTWWRNLFDGAPVDTRATTASS